MKRFAATILAFLYLVTSTGATVHMHYCMGKLISAGLWHSKTSHDDCSTCGMAKKKGCCEDKHRIVKLEKQYDIQPSAVSPTKFIAAHTFPHFIDYLSAFTTSFIVQRPLNNSPPEWEEVALYITNCIYRI